MDPVTLTLLGASVISGIFSFFSKSEEHERQVRVAKMQARDTIGQQRLAFAKGGVDLSLSVDTLADDTMRRAEMGLPAAPGLGTLIGDTVGYASTYLSLAKDAGLIGKPSAPANPTPQVKTGGGF